MLSSVSCVPGAKWKKQHLYQFGEKLEQHRRTNQFPVKYSPTRSTSTYANMSPTKAKLYADVMKKSQLGNLLESETVKMGSVPSADDDMHDFIREGREDKKCCGNCLAGAMPLVKKPHPRQNQQQKCEQHATPSNGGKTAAAQGGRTGGKKRKKRQNFTKVDLLGDHTFVSVKPPRNHQQQQAKHRQPQQKQPKQHQQQQRQYRPRSERYDRSPLVLNLLQMYPDKVDEVNRVVNNFPDKRDVAFFQRVIDNREGLRERLYLRFPRRGYHIEKTMSAWITEVMDIYAELEAEVEYRVRHDVRR